MTGEEWLTRTRISYDTVAENYATLVRDFLDDAPYVRGVLALFAEQVKAQGGPVADVGCGPGHVTAHLDRLGVEAFGVDLSPAMIEVARREHPGLRFDVGSMTDLPLAEASVAGLVAWYSLIHVPDAEIDPVLTQFHRVLRPDGLLLLGFHVGESTLHKTEGYGGHPMDVSVHRRRPAQVAARLVARGFSVEAQVILASAETSPAGILFARRRP